MHLLLRMKTISKLFIHLFYIAIIIIIASLKCNSNKENKAYQVETITKYKIDTIYLNKYKIVPSNYCKDTIIKYFTDNGIVRVDTVRTIPLIKYYYRDNNLEMSFVASFFDEKTLSYRIFAYKKVDNTHFLSVFMNNYGTFNMNYAKKVNRFIAPTIGVFYNPFNHNWGFNVGVSIIW